VCLGMEASGHARWFERLLAELNCELWIGDAAEIRTKRVGKQTRQLCTRAGASICGHAIAEVFGQDREESPPNWSGASSRYDAQ
jgi:hypothetical protein